MSYILDALKKSEKERQRGAVPDLMTPESGIAEETKKRPLWPYLIAGALILNAGLFAWWLAWHSEKPTASVQPGANQMYVAKAHDQVNPSSETRSSVATPPSEEAKMSNPITRSADEKKPVAVPEIPAAITNVPHGNVIRQPGQERVKADVQKNKKNKPAPATNVKVPDETSSVPPQQTPAVKLPDAESQPAAYPAPVKNKLYGLQELPASIQQSLPAFAISTHLYASDTSSRVVRINGQTLREGQFLTAGLKLEEIISEGVIFSYHNYRFRVGLK